MPYEKKYTEDGIVSLLSQNKREMTMREITNGLKCSDRTTKNLLYSLLRQKRLQKRNVGTEKRPLWMYSVRLSGSL